MNVQSFVVMVCVLAALVYLVRPTVRRWRTRQLMGPVAAAPADQTDGSACGRCKGCGGSSGGCH